MAEIEFRGVTKRYADGTEAVTDMNLAVEDGEFMILVGPSGCGKSTALRMIAGLEDVTEGDVLIDGEVVTDVEPSKRDIAMVFQNYALYPHMTVRKNMSYALRLAKVPKPEADQRVEDAARILDLTEHLERRPAQLSGGQRQRVAMGRAIVREPKAFLMDEPLSNLDAKLRVQMRAQVSRLQRRLETTTVYVTHDQVEAMTLGTRVAVMRGGRLQQVDRPGVLYAEPVNLFVAGFIGSPSMNFLPARLEAGRVVLPFGDLPLTDRLRSRLEAAPGAGGAARDVIVGLRPEAFEDAALAGDGAHGLRVRVRIDVVEALGSENFAYFSVERGSVDAPELAELAADAGADEEILASEDEGQVIARVGAASRVAPGAEAELVVDGDALTLFDPDSGDRKSVV